MFDTLQLFESMITKHLTTHSDSINLHTTFHVHFNMAIDSTTEKEYYLLDITKGLSY